MHTEKEFKYLVGEILSLIQTIEHDTKWIFASLKVGDLKQNYYEIQQLTLMETVKELEKLDESDSQPFLSHEDYYYLKQISHKRNYLVHQCFRDFIYTKDKYNSDEFKKTDKAITDFYNEVSNLGFKMENVRIQVLKKFRNLI